MTKPCCPCSMCLKCFVTTFNLLMFLGGLACIGASAAALFSDQALKFIQEQTPDSLEPWLSQWHATCFVLIGIGGMLLVMGFLGCYGAVKEASSLLCCYLVFLVFIMVAEATVLVFMIFNFSKIKNVILDTMRKYETDNDWRKRWDTLQTTFECCGLVQDDSLFQPIK